MIQCTKNVINDCIIKLNYPVNKTWNNYVFINL